MNEKRPQSDKDDAPMFDIEAADRERLDARLGGKPWTERAAGRDEHLRRETRDKIKKGLGRAGSKDAEPEK